MRQGYLLGLVIAFSLWLPLPAAGQTCNFFLYPSPLYTDSKAQTRSIYVYASDPNCSWASSGGASWAVTTGSGHADGSGYLDIAISSNTTGAERNANFTIAGQTV